METSPRKGTKVWGKAGEKLLDGNEQTEPRSVKAEMTTDWISSMATNVVDAFKLPVSKPIKMKSLNRINIPDMLSSTIDRFEDNENEPLPFRPKTDFNPKDFVTAEYFKVNISIIDIFRMIMMLVFL